MVFDDERLLNAEGLRFADECARHKVLDVVGDLALAGLPLLGAYPLGAWRPQAQSRSADARCSPTAPPGGWSRASRPAAPAFRPRPAVALVGGMVAPAYSPDVS